MDSKIASKHLTTQLEDDGDKATVLNSQRIDIIQFVHLIFFKQTFSHATIFHHEIAKKCILTSPRQK